MNLNVLRQNLENQLESMPNIKISDKKKNDLLDAMDFVFKKWMPAQGQLDTTLAGKNAYSSLTTDKGKTINYGHCILDELSELLNSIPWKHWKGIDDKIDYDNLKTEFTDLMHFIPAMLNVLDIKGVLYNINDAADEIKENKGEEFFASLANLSAYSLTYNYRDLEEALNDKWESDNIADEIAFAGGNKFAKEYKMIKRLIRVLTLTSYHVQLWTNAQEQIEEDDYTTAENELIEISTEFSINQLLVYSIVLILDTYAKIYTFDLSITRAVSELWESYLVKSQLNLFRANNGYKEGSYIKIWNGMEDNVVANQIAREMVAKTKDGMLDSYLFYTKLQDYYINVYMASLEDNDEKFNPIDTEKEDPKRINMYHTGNINEVLQEELNNKVDEVVSTPCKLAEQATKDLGHK